MSDIQSPNSTAEAGSPGLTGWLYQRDVSIWMALEFFFVTNSAEVIQLEPKSYEDAETDVLPPKGQAKANSGSRTVVMQAKFRSKGDWSHGSLQKLLEHERDGIRVCDRLQDTRLSYVLATNVRVPAELAWMKVREFSQQPADGVLPANLAAVFPPPAERRLALLAEQSPQSVEHVIERILKERLRLPHREFSACLLKLREEAFLRMEDGTPWHRSEFLAVTQQFGASVDQTALEMFVRPDCWNRLVEQLKTRHIVVIAGRSGTGKTTTARALCEYFKDEIAGLRVVDASRDQSQIRNTVEGEAILFSVDDPWGRYAVGPRASEWSDDLDDVFRRASPSRKFVITTRSDVVEAAHAEALIRKWRIPLEASSYSTTARETIYDHQLRNMRSGPLQRAADRAKNRVLDELSTPLEIASFFVNLAKEEAAENAEGASTSLVSQALELVKEDTIEKTVERQVIERHDEHWAAVVWGLMKARHGLDRSDVATIRAGMAAFDRRFEDGLEGFCEFFRAGGSLHQPKRVISYAHPRVEVGIELAMGSKPGAVQGALNILAQVLLDFESATGHSADTVARLLEAMLASSLGLDPLPTAVRQKVDSWLTAQLSKRDPGYRELLELTASVGSPHLAVTQLAKWFQVTKGVGGAFSDAWAEPEHPPEWYELVRGDPLSVHIVEQFVEQVLAEESRSYPNSIVQALRKFVPDLSRSFRLASIAIMEDDDRRNAAVIAFGAMQDEPTREEVLAQALTAQAKAVAAYAPYDTRDYWAITDGHYNEDYDYYGEPPDDPTSKDIIRAYVSAVRLGPGWQALASHKSREDLLEDWMYQIARDGRTSGEEYDAAIQCALDFGQLKQAWEMAGDHWSGRFAETLAVQVFAGESEDDVRRAAVFCLLRREPQQLSRGMLALIVANEAGLALELLMDCCIVSSQWVVKAHRKTYRQLIALLPPPYAELGTAFTCLGRIRRRTVSDDALNLARSRLRWASGDLRIALFWVCTANGYYDTWVALSEMTEDEEIERPLVIVRAAVLTGSSEVLWKAVAHPRGQVRLAGLEALTKRADGMVPEKLLHMASDRSSFVRSRLVDLLAEPKTPEELDALLVLAADRWSTDSRDDDDDHRFHPIARTAVETIAHSSLVAESTPEQLETLFTVALESTDAIVRRRLMEIAAEHELPTADTRLTEIIFDQALKWPRLAAADALGKASRSTVLKALENAKPRWFETGPLLVAVHLAPHAGSTLPESSLMELGERLAVSQSRRALLIPLITGASARADGARDKLLALLPPAHPSRAFVLNNDDGVKFDKAVLDGLGSTSVADFVVGFYKDRFAKRKNQPATE